MTQVISATSQTLPVPSHAFDIPVRSHVQATPARDIQPHPSTSPYIRNGHLNLDTFSPVHQNGSFAFDRVLKSGFVQKRTRKTKVGAGVERCRRC